MSDQAGPNRPSVVVCGAEHAALGLSLARSGCAVVLLEPDVHDRARLVDMLSRLDAPTCFRVTDDRDVASDVDVALSGASGPVPVKDVPVLSLDWSSEASTALHLTELPGRPPLMEILGPDTRGLARMIAGALGSAVLSLAREMVPPSQRLMAVLSAEIEALALTGATPEDVDEALGAAGFSPGPFELQDILGIDTCLAARRKVFARNPGPSELPLFARAVAEGRLGRKVGVGWYRYPGGGGKVEDPLIEDMAIEEARFAGLPRESLSAASIRGRVLAVLQAEVARIVREGLVSADEIVEVVWLSIGAPPEVVPDAVD